MNLLPQPFERDTALTAHTVSPVLEDHQRRLFVIVKHTLGREVAAMPAYVFHAFCNFIQSKIQFHGNFLTKWRGGLDTTLGSYSGLITCTLPFDVSTTSRRLIGLWLNVAQGFDWSQSV